MPHDTTVVSVKGRPVDIQTDRNADRQTNRQMDRHRQRTGRGTAGQTDRQPDRQNILAGIMLDHARVPSAFTLFTL